jgi:ADP-ribose pyrophosphatase
VTDRNWVPLEERVVHEGWVRLLERRYRMPNGRIATWELRSGHDSVGVLPLTPDGDVVLVRQFRPGPDRLLVTLPGGVIDKGETPDQAARRELREETGFAAESIELVATVRMTSSTQRQHVAIAYECREAGPPELDEFEDCEVLVMSPAEMLRLLRAGAMSGTQLVWPALDAAGLL